MIFEEGVIVFYIHIFFENTFVLRNSRFENALNLLGQRPEAAV